MLDFVIRRGRVVDGTGAAAFTADVAVRGGRVVEVGELPDAPAARQVEASGKVVCPGFIDIHSHNDLYIIREDYKESFQPFLRQGITTCVSNNCGWSVAPWPGHCGGLMSSTLRSMGVSADFRPEWESQAEWHEWMRKRGMPLNYVPLAGHNPIRMAVTGGEARFATEGELEGMKRLLREGLEAGCRGFSTGLTYFPGVYAHTEELVGLARVAADHGAPYVTHVRGYCSNYHRAVAEALEVARRSGASLQLSHVYAVPWLGPLATLLYHAVDAVEAVNRMLPLPALPNPALRKALSLVERGLEEGMDVGMDFVPYLLGSTTVTQLYPPWANRDGTEGLLGRLADPEERRRIRRDVERARPSWPPWEPGSWADNYLKAVGWRMLYIQSVGSEKNRCLVGERVWDLARRAGRDPFEWLVDLVIEEKGQVTYLFGMPPRPWSEKVFSRFHAHPAFSVGTDAVYPEAGRPSQSAYGCFARILGHYVRELGLYTLEEAVHRCTGMAASRFGLKDRGVIRRGAAADLLVLDEERFRDNSTFDDPARYPDGVEMVMVNGRVVVEGELYHPELLAGRLLTA